MGRLFASQNTAGSRRQIGHRATTADHIERRRLLREDNEGEGEMGRLMGWKAEMGRRVGGPA
jgi:hypothetical protein